MIGKPQWFKTRKYGGWGLSPATKEGWIYIAVFFGIVMLIQNLPFTPMIKEAVTIFLVLVIVLDVLDIMFHMKKDEREILHEALSERNASWAMITAMVLVFGFKAITSALSGQETFDVFLLVPIAAGVVAKAVTNFSLRNK